MLIQHLTAFYDVGEHNHIRLRGADWNDGLDMAAKRGESVAFTALYGGNLKNLAKDIKAYAEKTGNESVLLAKELLILLNVDKTVFDRIDEKKQVLDAYCETVKHTISGEKVNVRCDELCSAGDEPDGSAKFFATAFRNAKIEEAVHKLLNERDGLALGICNGFQALIKLGLVPNGKITGQDVNAPTLTYNTINRHISKMVYTKVVSNKSPWLQNAELGGVYVNPASHGEGRFVAPEECIKELFANGQVATQYVNQQGQPTMDEEWNVNGSYYAIEGITSPDGRCFGKMAHIERKGRSVATNIYGEQDLKVFESGVNYFK